MKLQALANGQVKCLRFAYSEGPEYMGLIMERSFSPFRWVYDIVNCAKRVMQRASS